MEVKQNNRLIAAGDIRKQATPLSEEDIRRLSENRYLLTSCMDHIIRCGLNRNVCKENLFVAPTLYPFITAPADVEDLKTKAGW